MAKESNDKYQIVWLHEEQCYGVIVKQIPFFALIKYNKDGIEYQTFFEEDEYTFLEEIGILHVEEDDEQDPLL